MSHPAQGAGRLTVIAGCMFSGKTKRLIALLAAAEAAGRRVRAFKHALDARYDRVHLSTHDGGVFPARVATTAADIESDAGDAEVIGIDEAQFFGRPLIEACERLRRAGRELYVVGIDNDSWGQPFTPLPELRRMADVNETLQLPCTRCGRPAAFTMRVTPVVGGNLVGGLGDFEPRCSACFVPLPGPKPAY